MKKIFYQKKMLVLILSALMMVLSFSGCVEQEIVPKQADYSQKELPRAWIAQRMNISISEVEKAVEELNIELYGSSKTKQDSLNFYEDEYSDWNLEKKDDSEYFNLRAWTSLLTGVVIIVSDEDMITERLGCRTAVLTSNAPLWTYYSYMNKAENDLGFQIDW
jgi:DNA-binding transcriptional MocR family regulator